MKRFICVVSLAFTVALGAMTAPPEASAAKVRTWHHGQRSDHDHARRSGLVLSETGAIRLGRKLQPLAKCEATHIWAVVEDQAGNLFAATGDEGKVYRVSGGQATEVYASAQSQVLSLATGAKGEVVYAGTGPAAQIVQLKDGKAQTLATLPESYVWALAMDPQSGSLYAATGPHGRIYKVTPTGKASVFYQTRQEHVLCLTVGADGSVYAGTDGSGRVYRIDRSGKGSVLYQTPQAEVRTLGWTASALFVGTCTAKKRPAGNSDDDAKTAAADSEVPRRQAVKVSTASGRSTEQGAAKKSPTEEKEPAKSKEANKGSPATAPSEPGSGENSVFRIALDDTGSVREVFRAKALILTLLVRGNRLLVGTGMKGQLFEVYLHRHEKTELARLDHGQLLGLCGRKDGSVVVAAGDPGQLYVLEDRYQSAGTLTSAVLDAKLVSRWGALRWRAEVPSGGGVSVQCRSGNVAEPDETWSDWGAEQTDGMAASVDVPGARYLQYRLKLTGNGATTPTLKSLAVRYATTNQRPEVTRIEVPDLSAKAAKSSKKIEFTWKATDANEDELRFSVYVKKEGWEDWVRVAEDLDKAECELDTTTTPEGVYRLKVVASDRTDNDEATALTGRRVSEPFVVCHTPPAVQVRTVGGKDGRMGIEAEATSPLVHLTAAAYSLNGKKWVNLFPADGLFDSKQAGFRFRTEALPPGAYTVVVRVKDAAGNFGTGDVVFRVGK